MERQLSIVANQGSRSVRLGQLVHSELRLLARWALQDIDQTLVEGYRWGYSRSCHIGVMTPARSIRWVARYCSALVPRYLADRATASASAS
jgi:hypothetical protein